MIKTNDKHEIVYIEKTVESNKTVVIFSHGITVNKSENGLFEEFENYCNKNGTNTIRFDFRGHGESKIKDEDCSVTGMIQDFISVYNYAKSRYDKIILVSTSFGCSINLLALREINTNSLQKIIFINPVISYKTTFTSTNLPWAKSFFPQTGLSDAIANSPLIVGSRKFKLSSLMATEFFYYQPELVEIESNINIDLHHGTEDTMVPYQSTYDFHKKASKNSKLYTYQASHGIKEERETLKSNVHKSLDKEI